MDERSQDYRKNSYTLLAVVLALVLAAAAFVAGTRVAQSDIFLQQEASLLSWLFGFNDTPVEETDLSNFWRVWRLMDEKFASASGTTSLSNEARIDGAIKGMVEAFADPYTVYLPPSEAEVFSEDISGNFSGVGMEVGLRNGLITIIAPLPETPAERAGLLSGDVIVKINETSTEGMNVDEAVRLIRGEKGSQVTLSIYREGETEFKTVTVTRDTINIPTVKTEQIDDIFVITLYSFNAAAEDKVTDALAEFERSGADKLIFDVRGNPGGYLQGAVEIASNFLDSGKVVVREQSSNGEEKAFRSRGRLTRNYTPQNFVVLVNGGSASAAEIFAGAMKDHQTATVIGTPTFGKGSVQELVALPDNSSLKVTVAQWLTPEGASISNGGLSPTIVIELTAEDREAQRDTQKEAAIRFLHGETVASQDFLGQFTPAGS